jgi:hypothetical protein
MKNRIRQLLRDWDPPATSAPEPATEGSAGPGSLPRGINMLVPVELCINRDLLISLLSASIQAIYRHKQAMPESHSDRELAEVEAALQQQLALRAWAQSHPGNYISMAMYPVAEAGTVEELETLEDPEDLVDF